MATDLVSWKRLSIEGAAIIASILFAFAIDAGWEQRQELAADNARLHGVYEELATHKKLISEAIEAHQRTLDDGRSLLKIISQPGENADADEIARLIDGLINFYQINAPFGSLETAISSGAIARMRNTALASPLASWPTAIEDLLEEQQRGPPGGTTKRCTIGGIPISAAFGREHAIGGALSSETGNAECARDRYRAAIQIGRFAGISSPGKLSIVVRGFHD